jgi:glycosyltransferase involved in cell wall biosynthesis
MPPLLDRQPESLRIAWLVYRGNPYCGGQGVYTRYLARELTELGHEVTVFSGQPYPELDDPEQLVQVPSLDLYRPENPFRVPWPNEFKTTIDVREFGIMCSAGFPEPYTFSLRARRLLSPRRADFDLIHDNQCLGSGLLGMIDDGWPVLATLHHPITVDRDLDLEHAPNAWRRFTLRRWYGFLGMQMKVARAIPRVVTVSESSKRDIVRQMDVDPERLHIVPVGVDPVMFRPLPEVARVPGRVMTTTSSDVPMKGLIPLLEALAKVRTERDAELVIIGKPKEKSRIPGIIERLGLTHAVRFVSGVSTERIVELYAEAEVAAVPSLYEGFSLPAVEAMACGVPVVATTGGAIPEVVGTDGETGLLVRPGDPDALAQGLLRALDDADLRARIGAAGRERALANFTWRQTAIGTVANYRALLDDHRCATSAHEERERALPVLPTWDGTSGSERRGKS